MVVVFTSLKSLNQNAKNKSEIRNFGWAGTPGQRQTGKRGDRIFGQKTRSLYALAPGHTLTLRLYVRNRHIRYKLFLLYGFTNHVYLTVRYSMVASLHVHVGKYVKTACTPGSQSSWKANYTQGGSERDCHEVVPRRGQVRHSRPRVGGGVVGLHRGHAHLLTRAPAEDI